MVEITQADIDALAEQCRLSATRNPDSPGYYPPSLTALAVQREKYEARVREIRSRYEADLDDAVIKTVEQNAAKTKELEAVLAISRTFLSECQKQINDFLLGSNHKDCGDDYAARTLCSRTDESAYELLARMKELGL